MLQGNNGNKKVYASLTTGCISGGIEAICVWPMEYMKTQLQLQRVVPGVAPPFNGIISGMRYTIRTKGFLSLYDGLGITLVGSIPKAGIRFGGNAYFKEALRGIFVYIYYLCILIYYI
jgi:solute carrier family 25 citrate transporter 1